MNLEVLKYEVQCYLKDNFFKSASSIALQKSPFTSVSSKELAQQLLGKQKAKLKLPSWFANDSIYYPPSLNIEQTSSEKTAHYKANLVSGEKLIDLTGGFGIDSVAFSKKVTSVFHCELNKALQQIASHNFCALAATNIKSIFSDGVTFALNQQNTDWIYIDPSRRNESKGKVFFLEDCLPNVPIIVDQLMEKTSSILIKTAPILDISVGLKALKYVSEIHIVAVNNEVKELLWVLNKKNVVSPLLYMVTIFEASTNTIVTTLDAENISMATFSSPLKYLYEPFSSLMKAGVFNWLSKEFLAHKIHPQTHLYTTTKLIDFPGRKFEIKAIHPYNKKTMRLLVKSKTNVVVKNFKLSVAEIRKKYKLQEGLEQYLFFVTGPNNKPIVIECLKISN